MNVKAAQRELKSCEQHLADIREIMILKEAKLNQLKAKKKIKLRTICRVF
jgi:hypothetical protein